MAERIMPAVPIPEWVPVRVAAHLAHREPRTVYDWITDGRIASKRQRGVTLVLSKVAIRLGEEVTRGRPKGGRS